MRSKTLAQGGIDFRRADKNAKGPPRSTLRGERQVIGTKFVLYRQHYDKSKRKIELVRDKGRK